MPSISYQYHNEALTHTTTKVSEGNISRKLLTTLNNSTENITERLTQQRQGSCELQDLHKHFTDS